VVLFTALIGPHFVDWTDYRQTFERKASAYIGRPVTVDGKASVRLLPTPLLSFTDIHIGDPEHPDVEMERFRAEVELAPLLKGEVRIIQMAVERPRFNIDISGLAENRGVFGGEWRLDLDRISLERLQIIEGSAVVTGGPDGQTWHADAIDAVIEASTLRGPARVEANFTLDGEPVELRLGFGRYTDLDTLAMTVWASSPRFPFTLSTDGTLQLSPQIPPSYEGKVTVEGIKPQGPDAPRSAWADFRASGAFDLEPAALNFKEVQVSYGGMERPLVVEATGQVNFVRPSFDIALSARQIDLDRTLGGGKADPFAIETALASVIELLPLARPPPVDGVLRLDAQGVVVGGSVIQAVGIDLKTAGTSWLVENFAAMLPGDTRVDLNGTLGLSAETTFRGHARIASRRPAAFASWWRGSAGSAREIGSFSVEADLDLSPERQQLSDLIATTADGALAGSVVVHRLANTNENFVDVDLNADRADLLETRALAELLIGKAVQAGDINQMTLSLSAEVLSAGGIEARSVLVEGGMEDGRLNFRRLLVADLAGASVDAHGSIQDPLGTPSGRIDASVKADDISGAAQFLLSVLPENRAVQRLEEVAPILSPMAADISAEAGAAGERISLEVSGSFADTHLSLAAEGAGSLADPETLAGTLKLHVDGEDSAKVLRQLGFDLLPVTAPPLTIDASFDGALGSAGNLKVAGSVAGVDLSYDAATAFSDGRFTAAGDFSTDSDDVGPALMLAGVAMPDLWGGHAVSASGRLEYGGDTLGLALTEATFDGQPVGGTLAANLADGVALSGTLDVADASLPWLAATVVGSVPGVERFRWSDAPFTQVLPENVSLDLTLNAATLDLGVPLPATDAKLDLALADSKLELDLADAALAGGALTGSVEVVMSGGEAEATISSALTGAALQSLVWERVGLPTASGTLDVSFEAAGRGRSMAAIVAALSGSGSFSVSDGRLNALNADALSAVMSLAEGDDDPDEEQARETFATLFGSGALPFGRATGSFSIQNGAIGIPTVSLAAGTTKVLADATLDLNALVLDSEWTVRIDEGGEGEEAQPYVPMTFHGPITHPVRDIDLVPLLDLMRSRFLQRQLKELEELRRQRDEAERREKERRAAEEAAANEAALAAREEAALQAARQTAAEEPVDQLTTGATGSTSGGEPAASSAPLELVPGPPPEPEPTPRPRRRRRAAAPAPAPEPQPQAPLYRTLPNGVVVKVR
jgi:hypothetical protein